ncbi:deaminase domain-containing protein [Anabaena sp. PCC 7108]|uniref:deaminase domain-containing protein n=1 Tax=Anabaena sp. PCC 7108 TaxID=163908 RepID=UPI00034B5FEA|nr:deaminase domain-containing protein [Anabaena sp. PCC 7108]
MEEPNLISDAANIRQIYLNKPFPKGNIAIIEVRLEDGKAFGMGATSRANSPAPKPEPKSKGGQFEPTVDSHSRRTTPMDTDAEYKVLSAIAETLEFIYNKDNNRVRGQLYLYTERKPCESCQRVINQFEQKFPEVTINISWTYPYPPSSN